MDLSGLCERAGLQLIDVRVEIRRHMIDSPERDRILKNLRAIQTAIQAIPIDVKAISENQPVSIFQYEWPHATASFGGGLIPVNPQPI